jgi:hypothetical protein
MNIRRATEADTEAMRRLWDEFTVEATFSPYPGNPFEPALVTDHISLVNAAAGVARELMREIAAVLRDEGRE